MYRIVLFSLVLTFGLSSQASECGVFRVVKGKVTFQKKNKSKFRKARINKKVCSGDSVRADADARAKIVMAGGNEINISPDTEVLIEKYINDKNTGEKKVLLNVIYGKIRSNVKQKYKDDKQSFYRVKTKSAVAGVRGTEFMMNFDRQTNQSRVVTFEGKVAVGKFSPGGEFQSAVTVGAGQFTSNGAGETPHAPKKVPQKEFAKMDAETRISGSTGPESRDVSSEAPGAKTDEPAGEESPKTEPKPNDSGANSNPKGKENRTPASVGGDANDFDNLVDKEISDIDLDPNTGGVPLDPKGLPDAPPIIDTRTVGGLPNYQPPPQAADQLLNQKAKVLIEICLPGDAGCS